VKSLGIDPVFFGVIMVVNLSMGSRLAPVRRHALRLHGHREEPLDRVCRAVWPLFFTMVAILLLITSVPPW